MAEYAARILLRAKPCERSCDGKGYSRYSHKLKKACVNGSHEVGDAVDPSHTKHSEHRTHDKRSEPQPEVLRLSATVLSPLFFIIHFLFFLLL